MDGKSYLLALTQQEKQQFLREMSESMATRPFDWETLAWSCLGAACILILFGLFMNWAFKRRIVLRRKLYTLLKTLKNQKVGAPRYKYKVDVVMGMPQGKDRVVRTSTADISPDGMFIRLSDPLPKDEQFDFKITLTDTASVKGKGQVKWTRFHKAEDSPPGVGVRFVDMSSEEKTAIKKWLKKKKAPRMT